MQYYTQKRVSEADLMKVFLKFRRRIERQSAEQLRSLKKIHRRVVVAAERVLQRLFDNDRSLIPVPVRAVANRRRFDRSRSGD
jgi:hypothetical protein